MFLLKVDYDSVQLNGILFQLEDKRLRGQRPSKSNRVFSWIHRGAE
jgi:hypothetical protein